MLRQLRQKLATVLSRQELAAYDRNEKEEYSTGDTRTQQVSPLARTLPLHCVRVAINLQRQRDYDAELNEQLDCTYERANATVQSASVSLCSATLAVRSGFEV